MKTFLISILLAWSVCSGLAQAPFESANTTNELSVWLWVPKSADLKAPATINLQAYVQLRDSGLKAGDCVNVQFFSNSKPLGSDKAVWHDMIRPHAKPGQAVPMWVMAAGFYPAKCSWQDVPAGNYSVTARAAWTNGLSAVSAQVTVSVLP